MTDEINKNLFRIFLLLEKSEVPEDILKLSQSLEFLSRFKMREVMLDNQEKAMDAMTAKDMTEFIPHGPKTTKS
jgi:hypothetical protein